MGPGPSLIWGWVEGWGYWDLAWLLGVNRDDQKLRGHSGEKLARKSRNSWHLNGRGCGCVGTINSKTKCAQFQDQIQTLKNWKISVPTIAFTIVHFCTELLQLSAQFLGTLVGYFSNERGFSVESSLQRISSIFLLWKRNDSSVVLYTWSWPGEHAASARAGLRKANTER